jgi:hypothetical protein
MGALAFAAIALLQANAAGFAQGAAPNVTTATACEDRAGERSCSFEIRIAGAITASTPEEIKQAFAERDAMMRREGRQNDWLMVHVDSGGGNVPAAIAVGRLLRAMDTPIAVDPDATCASACVLIVAGAAHRLVYGRVGIHRPYFETPATDFAVADVQPDLQEARRLGLDRATYLQRKVEAESVCRAVDPRDLLTIRLSLACMNAVLAGRHVERAPPCRNRAATCEAGERQWGGKRPGPKDQVTGDGFLISAE